MLDIKKYKNDIDALCQELSLARLDLIGSAAREDFDETSDVDVLVTFDGKESLFDRYSRLKERLQAIFEREADVIEERAIRNPYFRASIERDRVNIYGS
ncbi:MAG: nucleotidyltransferase family protein [Pyrinomonadaceae bacterium]